MIYVRLIGIPKTAELNIINVNNFGVEFNR